MNRSITIKETEAVFKNFPKRKALDQMVSPGNSTKYLNSCQSFLSSSKILKRMEHF